MRKGLSLLLVFLLSFSLVACSQTEKKSGIDKAKEFIRTEKYEEAMKELDKILDDEGLNLEVWDLIAETYIQAEEFDKADEWLEQYLEMTEDNLDNKDFDVTKAVDSIGDYARDIRREGEFVSQWYEDLIPTALTIDDLDYDYEIGSVLEFEVPNGTELYYSFYGSPKTKGIKYDDGIILDEVGYMYLDLVLKNKYGEYSFITSAYFDVYDNTFVDDSSNDDNSDLTDNTSGTINLLTPEVDLVPGTYTESYELRITNYNLDNSDLTITYTTNGKDPREYGESIRYYYDSIPLTAGDYELAIVAYDYDADEYSEVSYFNYYIDHPDMIQLGLYMLPDVVVEAYKNMFDQAGLYDIYVAPVVYENLDLTTLDFENLPDALITYGTYAEDLAGYGMVANVEDYFNLADYDFIGDAPNIGMYDGVKYMMPLSIRPEFMVYGDYEGAGFIDWEFIQGESDWYNNKFAFAADSPELFLGVYYGFGGAIIDETNTTLDKAKVIEALTMIKSLPEVGIGSKLYTYDEIITGLSDYKDEYFVMGDTIERNEDYYYSQVGQMPLSNGKFAKYYNISSGMFLSNLALSLDPLMEEKLTNVYKFMTEDTYYMSDIISAEGSLPAIGYLAEDYEFYLDMILDDYMAIIDNGISSIRSYSLYTVYDGIRGPLQDFVNGASPEEVAESIMLNLSNSGN